MAPLDPNMLYFYASSPQPCPYIPGKMERRLVTDLSRRDALWVHEELSRAGFRRSHTLAYCPVCQGCDACCAVRVPVAAFEPTRTQRRTWERNRDLACRLTQPTATLEQYRLFRDYQQIRHGDSDMAKMDFAEFQALVEQSPVETMMIEVRERGGALIGGCIADRLSDGLSAVYSFYDPTSSRRSLGAFIILWLIDEVRRRRSDYVYLGYWIPQSRKMAYKAQYHPLEVFSGGGWRRWRPDDADEAATASPSAG